MKAKLLKIYIPILIIITLTVYGIFHFYTKENPSIKYQTAKIERGGISLTINATGTINPTRTVQVGSQVSGVIQKLFADFNSEVKEGEVIAQIDPAVFVARVKQARANLGAAMAAVQIAKAGVENGNAGIDNAMALEEATKAEIDKARVALQDSERIFKRTEELYRQGVVSKDSRDSLEAQCRSALAQLKTVESKYAAACSEIKSAKAQLKVAEARYEEALAKYKQAKASLESAELDLDHTVIRSPVNGIVISRNVDVGQTVAASLQAPILFLIAEDLTRMQANTNVSEADIGRVKVDQEATFSIDAYPDETFEGKVVQIRNAPITVQNVVTYDVIIEVDNRDRKLRPGMTADVSVIISRKDGVLRIPNGALRFKPESGQESSEEDGGQATSPLDESVINRLSFALGLSSDQIDRVKDIFREAKEKVAKLRADRGSGIDITDAAEKLRMNIRQQIRMILTEAQRQKFDMIVKARDESRKMEAGDAKRTVQVWVLSSDGGPRPVSVTVGITDDINTELISGNLKEGDTVITGAIKPSEVSKSKSLGFTFRRF